MTARDRRKRPAVDEIRALLHGRTPPAVPTARRTVSVAVSVAVPLAEQLGLAG